MQLYANVRSDSRYKNQAEPVPFPVALQHGFGAHIWRGGPGGQYRTSDLDFFIKDDGMFESFELITGDEPALLDRTFESALLANNEHYLQDVVKIAKTNIGKIKARINEIENENRNREDW